jgi:hypothetical protein
MKLLYLFALAIPAFGASDLAVYTLLAPSTHSFDLVYDTSVTGPGAAHFFHPMRTGSVVLKESAIDLASGESLELKSVTGREAKAARAAPVNTADNARFLRVQLVRPVAQGAETRIRIRETHVDAASYRATETGFVFERPTGVTRNVVVLPAGYELTGSRSPTIVSTGADGRIRVSFFNDRDDDLPMHIEGRKLP